MDKIVLEEVFLDQNELIKTKELGIVREVDLAKAKTTKHLIQVAFSLSDFDTKKEK